MMNTATIFKIQGPLLHMQMSQQESVTEQNESLNKPRWQRQRKRLQTRGLLSRTMAVHVRCNSLHIS